MIEQCNNFTVLDLRRAAAVVLCLPLWACSVYDASLVGTRDNTASSEDAGKASADLPAPDPDENDASAADGDLEVPVSTGLSANCVPNPFAPAGNCLVVCVEQCNGLDDDCDSRVDEAPAASTSCVAAHSQGVCLDGECYIEKCLDGARDCDLDPKNGCEVAPDDVENCGACGTACKIEHGSPACIDGACRLRACDTDFGDCDGEPNGCETPLDTLRDCGSCGAACTTLAHAATSCRGGTCGIGSCEGGYGDCDDTQQNGCETALGTLENCGACGARCDKASCAGGVCTAVDCGATPGFADCDGDEVRCEVDLRVDVNHCGGCGAQCGWNPGVTPHASLACNSGACRAQCESGYGDCDGDYRNGCEQPLNSVLHCGGCGQRCSIANAVESCQSGRCAAVGCDDNFADCDADKASCEVAINTPSNCGGCGNVCALAHASASCPNRTCAISNCEASWQDCDGQAANGCERDVRALADGGAGPCLPDAGCTRLSNAGHDYYVCTNPRNWADAREYCRRQQNGDLAQFADAGELELVRSRVTAGAWIGLNDRGVESLWAWVSSGVPVWEGAAGGAAYGGGYTNWAMNEPNGAGDCAQLTPSGNFDDADCNSALGFVCEVTPDACPSDANKIDPGQCGCGVADADPDADGIASCDDGCPDDPGKRAAGACGCGNAEGDTDGDGTPDCADECDADPAKTAAGSCGCGKPETDSDGDGTPDCSDGCPGDPGSTTVCGFSYGPTNFTTIGLDFSTAPNATLNCGTTTLDTSPATPVFSNWCGSAPAIVLRDQTNGPGLAIIPLTGLNIPAGNTLRLVGNRAVVLAVLGDATIAGTIDASANGATPGAGGNWSCGASAGGDGAVAFVGAPGGGGGGGGFGSAGGTGGTGVQSARGSGGSARGNDTLSPLIGGCNGGRGGGCAGNSAAGGGAVQVSASNLLTLTGSVRADGAPGENGCSIPGGASGGGSGGAILLEAKTLNAGGTLAANGGKGGNANAAGGVGAISQGSSGSNGTNSVANGAGGGGGGYGRTRTTTR